MHYNRTEKGRRQRKITRAKWRRQKKERTPERMQRAPGNALPRKLVPVKEEN